MCWLAGVLDRQTLCRPLGVFAPSIKVLQAGSLVMQAASGMLWWFGLAQVFPGQQTQASQGHQQLWQQVPWHQPGLLYMHRQHCCVVISV